MGVKMSILMLVNRVGVNRGGKGSAGGGLVDADGVHADSAEDDQEDDQEDEHEHEHEHEHEKSCPCSSLYACSLLICKLMSIKMRTSSGR